MLKVGKYFESGLTDIKHFESQNYHISGLKLWLCGVDRTQRYRVQDA